MNRPFHFRVFRVASAHQPPRSPDRRKSTAVRALRFRSSESAQGACAGGFQGLLREGMRADFLLGVFAAVRAADPRNRQGSGIRRKQNPARTKTGLARSRSAM